MSASIKSYLRPPVELWSSGAAFVAAILVLLFPRFLLMPLVVAQGTAALFISLAVWRFVQAREVVKWQRNLRRLDRYVLRPSEIPVSRKKMLLGQGFKWTQTHTQRLYDIRLPENACYLRQGIFYRAAREWELYVENRWLLSWTARVTGVDSPLNPVRPLPDVGGLAALHGLEMNEKRILANLSERVAHTLVLGTTRVGKTRLAELLITQDIHRGDVIIVFDPKGDKELLFRMYAEARRAGREDEFFVFHLGYPELSSRYNPLGSFSRVTEVATRAAGQLPDEGNARAFKEFAWLFANIVARALVALGQKPDFEALARCIRNIEPLLVEYVHWWLERSGPEGWRDELNFVQATIDPKKLPHNLAGRGLPAVAVMLYIRRNNLFDPIADGLISAFEHDRAYFFKLISSLQPLLDKMNTGLVSELLSPDYANLDDDRPIFDFSQIIRRGGIAYIGLDTLSDAVVGGAVGNSMFADLTSVAGQMYKHGRYHGLPVIEGVKLPEPKISVHADEFNELIGPEFIPLLNKAGGAGFQVTAYTQTWSDVEARVGSEAKAGQIGGNLNTLIMLRVKNVETAEMLTNQLPKVKIRTVTAVSGVSDIADPTSDEEFQSRNEDRVAMEECDMLSPADLVQLPKGQAFALLEGGQLIKLRLPLPYDGPDPMMPKSIEEIARKVMA